MKSDGLQLGDENPKFADFVGWEGRFSYSSRALPVL
jgi:hypothetical protein